MSDARARIPPLFWIADAGSGLPMSMTISGRRAICFFSLELMALQYAEHYLSGQPGVDWYPVGSETPEALRNMAQGAPRQGFGGWVLNHTPGAGGGHHVLAWSELRDEVERKLEVGAAWGSVPRSSSLLSNPNEVEQEEASGPMERNDWREVPLDPETAALGWLSPPAEAIFQGPSPPFEKPRWVEDFERNWPRLELSGREGAQTLDAWRAQTEEKIEALLTRKPWGLLHVLALLRRLPTDAAFLGEEAEEGGTRRFDAYQADVTERAALKYARWDCSGMQLDAWEPGMPGLVQDRPTIDPESLAEVFSLVRLGGVHLAYLERMRRTVVRGNTVVLRPDGVSDSRPEPELQRRLDLYEERRRKFSFFGETAGTVEPSLDDLTEASGMSAAQAIRTTYRQDESGDWFRYELSRRLIRKRDKRFVLAPANLEPAYEYLKLLEEEVAAQYGLSPELIVAALSALQEAISRFVAPQGNETLVETFAERVAHLDKRGYLIVRDDVMHEVILGTLTAEAHRREFPNIPLPEGPEAFAHAFKHLAYLDSYRREDLSLEDGKPWVRLPELDEPVPMPTPFVYPAGDHRIVDLNAIGDFLQGIVDCLVLEEAPRQRVSNSLEQRLGDYFKRELDHQAFEPSKKLFVKPPRENKRQLTDLDVSVRVGSVLVAIDAKALQVSPGYRAYVHAAVRERWQKFEGHVEHADEQADKLAQQPRGTNYDLLDDGYTHVVTLLCSTVPEFIDTDAPNFFITDDLPRVATPPELRGYLAEVTEEDLKALPFARRIGGG